MRLIVVIAAQIMYNDYYFLRLAVWLVIDHMRCGGCCGVGRIVRVSLDPVNKREKRLRLEYIVLISGE